MIHPEHWKSGAQLFLLLVMVFLWCGPSAVLDPDVYIGNSTRDLYDHIALLDHWSFAVSERNYPVGGALIPPDLFSMVLAFPWFGLGRGVAFDLAIVLQLWLNCVAGWVLGRRFGSPMIGAVVIGFSPYLLGQANSGETETLSLWPLVLMVSALYDQSWKKAGVWAAVTAIGSWYYGAYAAVLLGIWFVVHSLRQRALCEWRPLGLFAGLIAIPAMLYGGYLRRGDQMFRGPDMHTYIEEQPRALAGFSSDPTSWLGELPEDANHLDALGWPMFLFALIGGWLLFRSKDEHRWWLVGMLGLGMVLALGPILHIDQSAVWDWMPYDLLLWIPPLDVMRLPHRWMAVATIALGALATVGARNVPLAAVVLIIGESVWFSGATVQHTTIKMPEVLAYFDGPVVQLPTRTMEQDARGPYLVMQKEHGHAIPYSLLMQGWSPAVSEEPFVIAFTALDSSDPIASRSVEARQFRQEDFSLAVAGWEGDTVLGTDVRNRLRAQGFQQLCVHIDRLPGQDATQMLSYAAAVLGEPDVRTAEALLWNL